MPQFATLGHATNCLQQTLAESRGPQSCSLAVINQDSSLVKDFTIFTYVVDSPSRTIRKSTYIEAGVLWGCAKLDTTTLIYSHQMPAVINEPRDTVANDLPPGHSTKFSHHIISTNTTKTTMFKHEKFSHICHACKPHESNELQCHCAESTCNQ